MWDYECGTLNCYLASYDDPLLESQSACVGWKENEMGRGWDYTLDPYCFPFKSSRHDQWLHIR